MAEPDKNTEFSRADNREVDLSNSSRNENRVSVQSDNARVPVNISDVQPDFVDQQTIAPKYYNNFNFSKLSKKYNDLNVAFGVTSANKGEGKTLVASNMAVSLSQAYRQRTVLVDMNFNNPELHEIFGTPLGPGLAEAMEKRILRINPTKYDDLFLLSAGESENYQPRIKDTMALREILQTLKQEFDFIIADMSAVLPVEEFPVHFINEIDGLITVIDTQNTRQEQLDKIHKHIDENRFVGYIFNKVTDKDEA